MRSKGGNACSSKYTGFQKLTVTIVLLFSFSLVVDILCVDSVAASILYRTRS